MNMNFQEDLRRAVECSDYNLLELLKSEVNSIKENIILTIRSSSVPFTEEYMPKLAIYSKEDEEEFGNYIIALLHVDYDNQEIVALFEKEFSYKNELFAALAYLSDSLIKGILWEELHEDLEKTGLFHFIAMDITPDSVFKEELFDRNRATGCGVYSFELLKRE